MLNTEVSTPAVKKLVLVGGGHSHLAVLKHLAMNPVPGLDLTLVTREVHTPYSGALPAFIAGQYNQDEMHIDLRPLAQFAGARLIHETVNSIDLENKHIILKQRPPLRFDILSLNIGSSPDTAGIPGAVEFAQGIKPIDELLTRWRETEQTAVSRLQDGGTYTITIVGGGPASIELAFAAQAAINSKVGNRHNSASKLLIRVVTADTSVLTSHNNKVREFAKQELQRRGIELCLDFRVTQFQENEIVDGDGNTLRGDSFFYATGASIPHWPGQCGLALNDEGFITVNRHLQSLSHPFVFVSGDAASIKGYTRPKSGVFAVRQGKPLALNLVRFATGKSLLRFKPQKQALSLMYTGDRKAIYSKGNRFFHGRWVWMLKDHIDKGFIRKYSDFPEPSIALHLAGGLTDKKAEKALRTQTIRCSGCSAKVGSAVLNDVLNTLTPVSRDDLLLNNRATEDAALVDLGGDRILVQSVDFFPAFCNDPWLFASIAANHCLSDIYAMGATPHSALAIVTIPFASRNIMRDTLTELMAGCVNVLNDNGTTLMGGHTGESKQLAFGLSINGFASSQALLSKSSVQAGDQLILCKPLGTGTLLAADMRYRARGSWMDDAFEHMLLSNRQAAECFARFGGRACTDITGFGLAGHLLEMLTPSAAAAELILSELPILDGALECLERAIFSSIHQENRLQLDSLSYDRDNSNNPRLELLFDPQTAGGLLGSIPADRAADCLQTLHDSGYAQASLIGRIIALNGGKPSIQLR